MMMDTPMGMEREARKMVLQVVRSEFVQQKERIQLGDMGQSKGPVDQGHLHFHSGVTPEHLMDGSYGHGNSLLSYNPFPC
jgi:hypothetical protein